MLFLNLTSIFGVFLSWRWTARSCRQCAASTSVKCKSSRSSCTVRMSPVSETRRSERKSSTRPRPRSLRSTRRCGHVISHCAARLLCCLSFLPLLITWQLVLQINPSFCLHWSFSVHFYSSLAVFFLSFISVLFIVSPDYPSNKVSSTVFTLFIFSVFFFWSLFVCFLHFSFYAVEYLLVFLLLTRCSSMLIFLSHDLLLAYRYSLYRLCVLSCLSSFSVFFAWFFLCSALIMVSSSSLWFLSLYFLCNLSCTGRSSASSCCCISWSLSSGYSHYSDSEVSNQRQFCLCLWTCLQLSSHLLSSSQSLGMSCVHCNNFVLFFQLEDKTKRCRELDNSGQIWEVRIRELEKQKQDLEIKVRQAKDALDEHVTKISKQVRPLYNKCTMYIWVCYVGVRDLPEYLLSCFSCSRQNVEPHGQTHWFRSCTLRTPRSPKLCNRPSSCRRRRRNPTDNSPSRNERSDESSPSCVEPTPSPSNKLDNQDMVLVHTVHSLWDILKGCPRKRWHYRNYPILVIWMPEHCTSHFWLSNWIELEQRASSS